MRCDLHMHSDFSDGKLSPAQLVEKAKLLQLIIALTDHNTTQGLSQFISAAKKSGVTAVPGIELSTDYGTTEFHLVGLFISPEHYDSIENLVKEFRILKEKSNLELIENLTLAGYEIDYDQIKRQTASGNVNRAHIATYLCDTGQVESNDVAFGTILKEGNGFYFPSKHLQLSDAIRFLRSIKAVPILAHPLQTTDENTLRTLLPEMCDAGLLGMETHHSSYDDSKIRTALQIASDFSLYKSGGSDFHREDNDEGIAMGTGKGNLDIPAQFYYDLLELHKSL